MLISGSEIDPSSDDGKEKAYELGNGEEPHDHDV
jgi:hypothetical protein